MVTLKPFELLGLCHLVEMTAEEITTNESNQSSVCENVNLPPICLFYNPFVGFIDEKNFSDPNWFHVPV